MLHRFPTGLSGDKVHQKRTPSGAPDWVETVRLHFPRWNRYADELCVTELGAVVWAVQMSTVEFHPWNSRREDPERPDEWRIDLDPGPQSDFPQVQRLINDTFGLPPMALWAQMNPQEQQQAMQLKMAPFMMKMQEQQARLDSHKQVADEKDETTLIKALIDKIMTPDVAHKLLNEYAGAGLTLPSDQPVNATGTGSPGGSS